MMRFHGEKMKDVTMVENILRSLTPMLDYVVCAIKESKDINALSLEGLIMLIMLCFQSCLLVHKKKMNQNSNWTVEERALKASTNTHSTCRGSGRGRGR